jgi:hypothetical protein
MKLVSLAVVGVICGVAASLVFGRTADTRAVRATRRRLYAHLIEFRLFADEPALIWRAQKALVRDNLRLLALVARPALILLLPMAWVFAQLDWLCGYGPLVPGQPAIVTAQMAGSLEPADAGASLAAPPGIAVETPPVRVWHDRQISWRIRPAAAVEGVLELTVRGHKIDKAVTAGGGAFALRRRVRSLAAFLLHPWERRIAAGDVRWVEVDYPHGGWSAVLWFLAISAASMMGFSRWFRYGQDE